MTDSTKLNEIAKLQSGYFTIKQAKTAGFKKNVCTYHVKVGNWQKVWRGIYRLAEFPILENDQYVLWFLWSCNRNGEPQGIYSHETALSIYGLSDISPSKLHMTVPLSFRRNSEIPGVLVLHKGIVDAKDVEFMQGFAVTKPLRTILDLAKEDTVSRDILAQAIIEGCKQGMIFRSDIQNREELNFIKPWIKNLF